MNSPLTTRTQPTSPRIGLALGGGGARGIAHVAILEVLDEMGLRPSIIAGTSIGALIGAAYASGFSAARIRAHLVETLGDRFHLVRQLINARSHPWQHFLNVLPLRSALLDPETLLDVILPAGLAENIEDCQIPLRVIATNMNAHSAETFDSGNLKQRVAASIAIPVVFSPVTIDNQLYADGGLANPLPVNGLHDLCDLTIAIDVTSDPDTTTLASRPRIPAMLINSVTIFQKSIIEAQLQASRPDLYLSMNVGKFNALQFNRSSDILTAAEASKDEFRRRLERLLSTDALEDQR